MILDIYTVTPPSWFKQKTVTAEAPYPDLNTLAYHL